MSFGRHEVSLRYQISNGMTVAKAKPGTHSRELARPRAPIWADMSGSNTFTTHLGSPFITLSSFLFLSSITPPSAAGSLALKNTLFFILTFLSAFQLL